jgi:hypothetical protein
MSLWFRSVLLAGAMLMAGAAQAGCAFLGASTPSWSHSETTSSVTTTYAYNCDGDVWAVTVTETWSTSGGDIQNGLWQQTVSGPGGSTHAWGTGVAPIFQVNLPDFDPRKWRKELAEEPDPEY